MERVQFAAAGGVHLEGDLYRATDDHPVPVVLCHPHPDFGGDRFHPLLTAMVAAAVDRRRSVLRFDFRRSGAARPTDDLAGALDALAERRSGPPVDVIGYSFGAQAALSSDDQRIRSIVAVAPPALPDRDPGVPVLILVPEHDQFCPPDVVHRGCVDWSDVTVETIAMTDHFLAGRMATVTESALDWLDRRGAP